MNTQYTEHHYKYAVTIVEAFFEENECTDLSAFDGLFHNWMATDKAKHLVEQLEQKLYDEEKNRVVVGLEAISTNNYTVLRNGYNNAPVRGLYMVSCNDTNLRGLITRDGAEALPCIFDSVHVTLDGFIEVRYKGLEHTFHIDPEKFALQLLEEKDDEDWDRTVNKHFVYAGTESYMLSSPTKQVDQEMLGLLKKNHSLESLL